VLPTHPPPPHQNDPNLFQPYPRLHSESVGWARQHTLDERHAWTHSLFLDVASYLRSHTTPKGSRATCLPFVIQHKAATATATATTASRSTNNNNNNHATDAAADGCGNRKTRSTAPSIIEFTSDDLKSALASDYLNACTGRSRDTNTIDHDSNHSRTNEDEDENKNEPYGGWRMDTLTNTQKINPSDRIRRPQQQEEYSFQSQRLHWHSVVNAPHTVVFNSAGAHISSQLAPTSLAALHGLNGVAAGVCLNVYLTKADLHQSAPPHTDKQDVVVVQTQGRKRWRVYAPSQGSTTTATPQHGHFDPFCRGKGDDALSVQVLRDENAELLVDIILVAGDVLFIPARFPHTTDTLKCYANADDKKDNNTDDDDDEVQRKSSIHLTIGLDTHIYNMNFMSMRVLALRRWGIHDCLNTNNDQDSTTDTDRAMNTCTGKVNQLSYELREGLFSSLDNYVCDSDSDDDDDDTWTLENMARTWMIANDLLALHDQTNVECDDRGGTENNSLTLDHCVEAVIHFQTIGRKIKQCHEDMYHAALEEEQKRTVEGGGWAINVRDVMVKERADRLSIFRVPVFFERLDLLRDELRVWGNRRQVLPKNLPTGDGRLIRPPLPIILLSGDHVEIYVPGMDAGGNVHNGIQSTWSSANIVKVRSDGLYNLVTFDGAVQEGVARHDIKGPHGLGLFL